MIDIKNKEDCTSCSACFNICPVGAISMEEDIEGFKYPKIDLEKCIKCNLCEKSCPMIEKAKNDNFEKPIIFAAWSKDEDIRLDSTSGGIFSEIAKVFLKDNQYVCGAVFNENWQVDHILSNDIKDLENLRSSKYLQSNIKYSFKEIKKLLDNHNKVLFCGSPCQVNGLYKYLRNEYENLYTIDFICRGMNSPKIFRMYLESLEKKYKSKVNYIKFKHKIRGWHNFSTKIQFENNKVYIGGRYEDSYMRGYLKYNAFMRPSCYNCKFKEFPRVADITVADFWGIENIDKNLDENKGTSMVLINSKKGKIIFEKTKENVFYKEIKSSKIFDGNICISASPERTINRDNVFQNIDKYSYEELNKRFFPNAGPIEKFKIFLHTNKKIGAIKKKIKKYIKK